MEQSLLLKIKQWYAHHFLQKNEDSRLTRALLSMILIYILGSVVLLVMDLIWGNSSLNIFIILGICLQIIPLLLVLQGNLPASSFATTTLYIGFTTIFATLGQGIRDYVIMIYPVIITFAGLTIRQRGLIVSTFLTLLCLAWLILGEMYGWFMVTRLDLPTYFDLFFVFLLIVVASITVRFLVSNLEDRHEQTRKELLERRDIEASLLHNRQNLQSLIENLDGSIWAADSNYRLMIGNSLYHRNVSAAIGRKLNDGENLIELDLPKDALNEWKGYYDRALRGEKFTIEVTTRFTSAPLVIEYRFNPIIGEEEKISGVTVFGRDITERKRVEEALRASNEDFQRYFNISTVGMAVTAPEKGWVEVNDRLCQMLGYSKEELTQLTWTEVTHPDDLDSNLILFEQLMSGQIESYQLDKRYICKDKSVIYTTVYVTCHRTPNGRVHHLLTSVIDISKRKLAEQMLRDSEERFRLLFETMIQGVVYQSANGEIISANHAAQRLLGLSIEQMQGRTSMDPRWKAIHEDGSDFPGNDHPAMVALRTGMEVRNKIMGVFNPLTEDYRWINVHAVPQFRPGESTPYQVYATFDDITAAKRAEDALRASENRYRLLAENISDVIWILDVNEFRFRYVSPSVERLRGYTAEEVMEQDLSAAIAPESLKKLQNELAGRIQKFMDGEEGFNTDEVEQPCKNGTTVWTEATTSIHINPTNGHIEVYGVSRDITERKNAEQKMKLANLQMETQMKQIQGLQMILREQSIRDPLTNLYNRRYLDETLMREFERVKRDKGHLSIIIADIDHFKNINDSMGHQVGDKYLIAISKIFERKARQSDIVCRYGGEEFLIMMPDTGAEVAKQRAEDIRRLCSEAKFTYKRKSVIATLSFGVATYPEHGNDPQEIIQKADEALYRSKALGRNCVTVWARNDN